MGETFTRRGLPVRLGNAVTLLRRSEKLCHNCNILLLLESVHSSGSAYWRPDVLVGVSLSPPIDAVRPSGRGALKRNYEPVVRAPWAVIPHSL